MVLYTQTQQDCLAVEVSIAFNSYRVFLVIEDFMSMHEDGHLKVVSISTNPKYIDWLSSRRNHLKDLFKAGKWFISNEHRDGDKKYLRELKIEISELVNHSDSGCLIDKDLNPINTESWTSTQ
jgi:hypothetical protein